MKEFIIRPGPNFFRKKFFRERKKLPIVLCSFLAGVYVRPIFFNVWKEDLDGWIILKNYPSKSDYQKVDKLKMHFLDTLFVIDRATKRTANIVNNLNPLWNPVPPSGKSITDRHASSYQVAAFPCDSTQECYSEHAQERRLSIWSLG